VTQKVLTKKTFIGGALRYPGELVDVDAKGNISVAPAPSTPIGNMTVEQLEAALAARREKEGKAAVVFGSNVADPTPNNTGAIPVEIADTTVRSPGTTRPQGAPPGGEQASGGAFVLPASADQPGGVQRAVAPGAADQAGFGNAPVADGGPLDLDKSGDAGGSMTKAEIAAELDRRGVEYPSGATKGELQTLLSQAERDQA